jgi:hypothetical protein
MKSTRYILTNWGRCLLSQPCILFEMSRPILPYILVYSVTCPGHLIHQEPHVVFLKKHMTADYVQQTRFEDACVPEAGINVVLRGSIANVPMRLLVTAQ